MKTLLFLTLNLCSLHAFCQTNDYYKKQQVSPHQPYWTAITNPSNGNTDILFFDAHGQVIYREELRAQLVKPTKRNIKRLDKMLESMTTSNLVTSQVNTIAFPTSYTSYNLTSKIPYPDHLLEDSSSIGTRVFTRSNGKLTVYVLNPSERRVRLTLTDSKDQTIYYENIFESKYGRDFNISGLATGEYKLTLKSDKVTENFNLAIGFTQQYHLTQIASN